MDTKKNIIVAIAFINGYVLAGLFMDEDYIAAWLVIVALILLSVLLILILADNGENTK